MLFVFIIPVSVCKGIIVEPWMQSFCTNMSIELYAGSQCLQTLCFEKRLGHIVVSITTHEHKYFVGH